MNRREKEQKTEAVNIENNSASYLLILTAIIIQIVIINSTKKSQFVVRKMGSTLLEPTHTLKSLKSLNLIIVRNLKVILK